ncbi:MAG: hypothetical protein IKO74_01830 [Selenomonadaceae bacterium]|nr:hypothetical protein [Selenomonadaceae bacterium]
MFDNNPEEHYLKQGDPNKPTYYIIRHMNEAAELSEIYRMTAGHIWYALSKSWLPVVDMKNYSNLYLPPEKLGAENSWEYYFEQPLRITLEQAYSGENVVLSDGFKAERFPDYSKNLLEKKDDTLAEWRMLVKWGFLKIKPVLAEEINGIREDLFLPKERVLGVLLRGKNYSDEKNAGQPVSPSAEFAATVTAARFKEWKCHKIFLVTKDSAVLEIFKNKFEDKCVLLDQVDFECYDSDISGESESPVPENQSFLTGKKYLTPIMLLSLCDCLVAERCGDATNAMLMASKFANTYFFNLGVYGMINLGD